MNIRVWVRNRLLALQKGDDSIKGLVEDTFRETFVKGIQKVTSSVLSEPTVEQRVKQIVHQMLDDALQELGYDGPPDVPQTVVRARSVEERIQGRRP